MSKAEMVARKRGRPRKNDVVESATKPAKRRGRRKKVEAVQPMPAEMHTERKAFGMVYECWSRDTAVDALINYVKNAQISTLAEILSRMPAVYRPVVVLDNDVRSEMFDCGTLMTP